ncbi:unnamed protein product, partial [Staurois parvus]
SEHERKSLEIEETSLLRQLSSEQASSYENLPSTCLLVATLKCWISFQSLVWTQGRTDNSWGPLAISDHGAPVSLPKLKKAYEKGTRGISWGPLLTPGPRAVPGFLNGQSAPV